MSPMVAYFFVPNQTIPFVDGSLGFSRHIGRSLSSCINVCKRLFDDVQTTLRFLPPTMASSAPCLRAAFVYREPAVLGREPRCILGAGFHDQAPRTPPTIFFFFFFPISPFFPFVLPPRVPGRFPSPQLLRLMGGKYREVAQRNEPRM